MKRRLTEVADFHHAASKALRVPAEGSEGPSASQAGTPGYLTSPELHTELVRWAMVIEPSLPALGTLLEQLFVRQPARCHSVNPVGFYKEGGLRWVCIG